MLTKGGLAMRTYYSHEAHQYLGFTRPNFVHHRGSHINDEFRQARCHQASDPNLTKQYSPVVISYSHLLSNPLCADIYSIPLQSISNTVKDPAVETWWNLMHGVLLSLKVVSVPQLYWKIRQGTRTGTCYGCDVCHGRRCEIFIRSPWIPWERLG